MEYTLTISGCDDETVLRLHLNPDEIKLLKDLCSKSVEKSKYPCQPILELDLGWNAQEED